MAFKKGQSGNPKGRPKGSTDEKTKYIRDWVVSVIGSNAQELLQKFNKLSVKERWRVITQLLPYAIPKQTETKISGDIDLSTLSDEQLDKVLSKIINEMKDDGE